MTTISKEMIMTGAITPGIAIITAPAITTAPLPANNSNSDVTAILMAAPAPSATLAKSAVNDINKQR